MEKPIHLNVDLRELSTILAALRLWQAGGDALNWSAVATIADNAGTLTPLTDSEVGALCYRLNTES